MTADRTALRRFSFNQATAQHWALPEVVAGCVAAGVPGIGLWREPVAEYGLTRSAKLVRDAGLAVTTLCRGGFFTAEDWREQNLRAIDEAATLGAPVLVLVSGGLPAGSKDIDGARARVADAIAELAPHADAAGVTIAIEPLHPMFSADRCVIATLGQALDIAERFDPSVVGVVVDAYHVWWDDTVYHQIARAGEWIASFQVCDWITPLPEGVLLGRALPGDGCIELRRLREAVDAAGYTGPIEVEVFNAEVWARPGDQVLAAAIDGYLREVA
ncbi:Sugar phosphate isomerase/epimerase [Micromonospora phaseoli]|uniref:Sugar phosphate isomerase/epimerase n=1 Tax=Micromonospora phaseoli TaxID=1144548 RepID=A0A1H6U6B2_9ACTN|nr:sugar phosphate isomerase/epimerase family protein [Micromonospora phaseoli]PZV98896.1 sugar phosphate isomerase/epimerase [Micromonospora phaseoli]GIJ76353.1 xylose isomerase [Micromonospora phaseoli]SEI87908.1 Sugar phosphate isomerase/epimerase [Micromonospora phaseoli]